MAHYTCHSVSKERMWPQRQGFSLAGLKSRYTYAAVFSKIQGKFSGIAKFDLSAKNGGAVAGQIEHGSERYGGEAVFVEGSGPGTAASPGVMTLPHCYPQQCCMVLWRPEGWRCRW